MIDLAPEKMLAAWQRGEVDAAGVRGPTPSQLQADGSEVVPRAGTGRPRPLRRRPRRRPRVHRFRKAPRRERAARADGLLEMAGPARFREAKP
ncbi:MAG: hypothetical protein ACOC84_10285, partial [Actinomycetota bacterium]